SEKPALNPANRRRPRLPTLMPLIMLSRPLYGRFRLPDRAFHLGSWGWGFRCWENRYRFLHPTPSTYKPNVHFRSTTWFRRMFRCKRAQRNKFRPYEPTAECPSDTTANIRSLCPKDTWRNARSEGLQSVAGKLGGVT